MLAQPGLPWTQRLFYVWCRFFGGCIYIRMLYPCEGGQTVTIMHPPFHVMSAGSGGHSVTESVRHGVPGPQLRSVTVPRVTVPQCHVLSVTMSQCRGVLVPWHSSVAPVSLCHGNTVGSLCRSLAVSHSRSAAGSQDHGVAMSWYCSVPVLQYCSVAVQYRMYCGYVVYSTVQGSTVGVNVLC